MTAALISSNIGYALLTFLPPILWLLFYLHEDRRPEPKRVLVLAFAGGMAAAVVAILVEVFFWDARLGIFPTFLGTRAETSFLFFFFVIAVVEEYVKYLPIKFLIVHRRDFDEPVDAMIYMMTAAMGFAALENALFAIPLFRESFFSGLEIITNRFLGANLLHALSSAIVGYFLAKSFLSPYHNHLVALGILIASILHTIFNYLILKSGELPFGALYLFFLLLLMTIVVLIEFGDLKKRNVNFEQT